MRAGADVVLENVPGPAVLHRVLGVPVAGRLIVKPVQEHRDVAPGQLCNSLLHSLLLRPRRRERPHVGQIPR